MQLPKYPQELRDREQQQREARRPTYDPAPAPVSDASRAGAWASAALDGEVADVANAANGTRNHALNKAAYSLGGIVAGGHLDEAHVVAALTDAADRNGLLREDQKAVLDTIRSGLEAGKRNPRHPQERQANAAPRRPVQRPSVPNQSGRFELTEDGVALAFTERYRNTMRYDHNTGKWHTWTGDKWADDGTGKAFSLCREVARDLSEDAKDGERATVRKRAFAAGVEKFAQCDPAHAVTTDVWDQDPYILGVPGGAVDLRNGRSLTADPAAGITKHAAVAPAEHADCPNWLRFLEQATSGDAGVVEFLKRWCGYCLTGDTREHQLIFIYGGGGNGKSVFLNTVTRIMGDYATTAAMDTFVSSRGDKHPTELALLRGARLVSASETEEGRAWAEARIKQMTGGDPITARFMRQDFFTYTPQFKLTIVGNHAPALANVDDAARRRFNIVPFTVKPKNPDRQLEEKLQTEWPGILRWMIEGAVAWRQGGLERPESITAATAEYFSEQDLLQQWLQDRVTARPGDQSIYEAKAKLFKDWTNYARAAGEEPGNQKTFAGKMRRHGFADGYKKLNGASGRVWFGVELPFMEVPGNE
ncbi:phage/plasmid primase, P4 family [Mangrovicoccus sp. HB161399]|uniref:phage/plasmid primase, P4 family n=1 Tax=Mangrovicoccus sp. HB161399 TaxID=2720392 RepID=UPI001C12FCB2|nr:phage/plasmid primase, P4 family [Mangrovicoccus sp. HB161399]